MVTVYFQLNRLKDIDTDIKESETQWNLRLTFFSPLVHLQVSCGITMIWPLPRPRTTLHMYEERGSPSLLHVFSNYFCYRCGLQPNSSYCSTEWIQLSMFKILPACCNLLMSVRHGVFSDGLYGCVEHLDEWDEMQMLPETERLTCCVM